MAKLMMNALNYKEVFMIKVLSFVFTLCFFIAAGIAFADAPHQVGGFVLNQDIKKFQDRVIMDTALPVRYAENIEEVEIKFTEGFKSGIIAYGTCDQPGHIVRIKLKYADSSKKFYKDLLKRFKKRFGEPDEYRGDPFKIVDAWKWSFVDQQNHRISLTLQHNTKDEEEKMGNSVKLTDSTLMEKDLLCYKNKQLDYRERVRRREWKAVKPQESGWELFLPR
jgi:hypothetical protein